MMVKQRVNVRSRRDKYTLKKLKQEVNEKGWGCSWRYFLVAIILFSLKDGKVWAYTETENKCHWQSLQMSGWGKINPGGGRSDQWLQIIFSSLPWKQWFPQYFPRTLLSFWVVMKHYIRNKTDNSLNSHPNYQRWEMKDTWIEYS